MKRFKQILTESSTSDLKVGDKIRVIKGNMMSGVVTKIDGNQVYFDHATATYQTVWSGAKGKPKQYVAHISNVKKESVNEAFSKDQLDKLKKEYGTLEKMDVTSSSYKKLIALLNNLDQTHLKSLVDADIKFISKLAKNRLKESLEIDERCWDGYKPTPGVKAYEKGSCMKEEDDIQEEAEHEGKKVTLNKPFRTPDGPKKFAVYVKNDKGNVVKVTFGDPNMEIKRDDPDRRANYRARHNCSDPGPKWKANYWSCKMWDKKPVSKITEAKNSFDFSELDGPKTKRVVGGIVGLSGSSPEDALTSRFKSMGYDNINVSVVNDVISVSSTHGKSKEKNYYAIKKSMSESAPPDAKIEKWILDNKERFKKQYGEDKGLSVLYAKAWSMYNNK